MTRFRARVDYWLLNSRVLPWNWVRVGRWARKHEEPVFTGNCPVRQHTGDGDYVGRCWYSTYDGRCHLHGDVSCWLVEGADLGDADDRMIGRARKHDKEKRG